VNRYNGTGNGNDGAQAIALDKDGNVLVTGYSVGGSSNKDYATIAYSSSGLPLWTNRFNGTGNGDDNPLTRSCLAIGSDGAVFVTGASTGNYYGPSSFDFATVCYVHLPEIIVSPFSRTNLVGSSVTFSLVANGTGSLSYQWKRNGTNLVDLAGLSGAITDSFTISNITLLDSANYFAVVSSPYGSVTSSVVTLTVEVPQRTIASGPAIDNGQFVVRFQGASGLGYTVEYTKSLSPTDWKKLATFTAPEMDEGFGIGVFEVRDAIVPSEQRYYRAVFPEY